MFGLCFGVGWWVVVLFVFVVGVLCGFWFIKNVILVGDFVYLFLLGVFGV